MRLICIITACLSAWSAVAQPTPLPRSDQPTGDPERGKQYLLGGGYIGAGIPVQMWRAMHLFSEPPQPLVDRPGVDPSVPIDMNQYISHRGIEVVSGVNCLGCHGTLFRGEYVIGLGNTSRVWADSPSDLDRTEQMASLVLSNNPAALNELRLFLDGARTLDGEMGTPFRGLNPAFRLEEVSAASRDPETLARGDVPVFHPSTVAFASDVPPLWNLRKKHALYYNGMGRGEFARLILQIGMVLIEDVEEAEDILPGMQDVVAYLMTIEPPKYPLPLDSSLVRTGEKIFSSTCSSCHGTYGEDETYPNLLVPTGIVGTDPHYAQMLEQSQLIAWFNRSWFAADGTAYAKPSLGYIAPPLDGVWATAPYFHNGAVPTLSLVLDSTQRPTRWKRSFSSDDYDLVNAGWIHADVSDSPETGAEVFDTKRTGYSAQGHTFGDHLTADQRRALLEYLKSL